MPDRNTRDIADAFLAAWNTQDVEKVAACYSENLCYLDPNIKGEIRDLPSFKRYLEKLLGAWDMTWVTRDAFPLKDMTEATDKVASPRSMDGSPFSMVDKPLKMKGDENHVFRRPPADEARDGFGSNLINGYALLWRAVIRRAGKKNEVEIDGMDLVMMEGNLISQNEVYFDRTPLASLSD